ncbi:MAG: AAA family ATPase [Patescibacteria group bacterium]
MRRVIGFVGWPCAGKDEAAEYLQKVHGAQRFGHSDFIRKLAAQSGNWSPTTDQLSALFEERAANEGYGWIARQVQEAVVELWTREPRRLVVVSGVRNLAEVEVYNDLHGFQLVKLEADFNVRLARARRRQRMGEQGLTGQRFREIEQLAGNANIPDLMALDGPVIVNNQPNKLTFHRALDRLVMSKE